MAYAIALALLIGVGFLLVSQRQSSASVGQKARHGPLALYFAQMTQMQVHRHDSFFVTAMASDKTHFLQVSVTRTADGWVYRFDMPITAWSERYADVIEDEARARGLSPARVVGKGAMRFLDIDFTDRAAHDTFVIWVVQDVFHLPEDETFEVTWG